MKQVISLFAFSLLLLHGDSFGQTTHDIIFAKGDSLQKYYPLDSIQEVMLHNLKDDHTLTRDQVISLALKLKTYVFDVDFARTKPGHIWGTLFFLNGSSLPFYSNSTHEIIITGNGKKTFTSTGKLNFDNY